MKKLLLIWQNIKLPIDIWFFFLFLFTFFLSIRKVILYFPIEGTFNEWAGIYVYISDIFLSFTIILWLLLILCDNYKFLSTNRLWITWLKHNLYTTSRRFIRSYYLSIPLLFVAWSFLSMLWSSNQTIALFRSIKLLEYYLLYLYIICRLAPTLFHACPVDSKLFHPVKNVPRGTFYKTSEKQFRIFTGWNIFSAIIIFIGLCNSVVAIAQIWTQKSLGLRFLRESIISPAIPGVAKILFHGEHYIRAYGLFPHPNIFGGYLLISIILTLLAIKLFHVEHVIPSPYQGEGARRADEVKDVPRRRRETKMFHVEHYSVLRYRTFQFAIYTLLAIQLLALILTFSKSAILGLVVSLIFLYRQQIRHMFRPVKSENVPRGTFSDNGTSVKQIETLHDRILTLDTTPGSMWNNSRWRIAILSILIILTLALIFNQELGRNLTQSLQERNLYLNVSRGTILSHPIVGIGIGQFVLSMQKYSFIQLTPWQFQPVHNVFLLIWSELGLVGLALFIFFLYNVIRPINNKIVPRPPAGEAGETSLPEATGENVPRETMDNILTTYHKYLQSIIIGFIFIMLWDHYNFDIQQGEAAMWVIFGLAAGISSVAGKKVDF